MARLSIVLALLLTLALGVSLAQTQAINGSIRGHVIDAAGASVPLAKVTATNADNGFTRSIETSDTGLFVLPNLPLGNYTVTIQKEGFDTQRHTNVVLDAGTEGVIDAQLKVGSVTTTMEVTGGASVIEPSRVSTGRTLSHEEVDNLPLTSRNPYNFVLFQPGVSGHPNPELGIPRMVNTNGLDNRVQYQMDGMVATESDQYGLRLFAISDSYVREVQAVSNSFAPEFGRTTGDIYNAITNSGTNQFHGEFYFIGRPPGWSPRPILLASNQVNPGIDLHDYSMNAGGAIKKDKIFVFGAYEHLLRGTPTPVTITPANAALIGLPTSQLATAGTVQHVQFLDLRIDWNINSKNQFFVRYNYFRNEYPFNSNNGGLNALDAASDFHDRAHVGGFQLLTTFSATALNELRASEPYRNEHHVPDAIDGPGPYIVISGIAQFNGTPLSAAGSRFGEKIPSLNDNFTKIVGKHTVKTGFGWQQNNDNQTSAVYNQYTFPNIASYLAAKNDTAGCTVSGISNPLLCYSSFSTTQGNPGASYKSNFYDFFLQDSWQIRPNLLLIYGIRYDYYASPAALADAPFIYNRSFHNPTKDWAPRLGIAYSITPKTVLRVSTGIFYDVPSTNLWYQTYANGGLATAFQGSFTATSTGAPFFPNSPTTSASLGTPTIYALTPNYRTPYTINSSIQIARQLTQNDALTVGYVNTQARELTYMRDMNLINPTSYLADGRPVYAAAVNAATRLYPQFNGIRLMDSGANANYNALIVNLTHRVSAGFSMSASYTWSHSLSDTAELWGYDQSLPIGDPTNRNRDYGNSIINRPNAFTMSAVFMPNYKLDNHFLNRLANGNQLTMLANISSGDQESIVTSSVLNNDPIGPPQRPLFIGRNTVTTPAIYQIDMRYTRTLYSYRERLNVKFLAEANNVFNTRNITATNVTAATTSLGVITAMPTFAPISSTLEGRLLQIGIRADW
jgi:hypothetical protein